jgi:hypothetical protein
VGEAMPVDAGETGVGRSRAESEAEATSPGGQEGRRAKCEGGGKIEREG